MGSFGDNCIDRSGGSNRNQTLVNAHHTVPVDGTLIHACIYCKNIGTGTASAKIKVFRPSGSNLLFVGESSSQVVSDGVNVFSNLSIPVQAGDYIGAYFTGPTGSALTWESDANDGWIYYQPGDITSDTLQSDWSSYLGKLSVRGWINDDIYVKLAGDDNNDGSSWDYAKKNVKEGLNVVKDGGTLHLGFEDYSSQPSIKFTKNLTLKCETVGGSGGSGTTILPAKAWQECDFSSSILDRQNTNYGGTPDYIACVNVGHYMDEICIATALAQRFTPSFKCLDYITLKLKRILDADLYVEIREDASGAPSGTPQDGSELASVTIPYSDITTFALTDYDINFDLTMSNTNPKWIVVCLYAYDPNFPSNDVYYKVGWDANGTSTEYYAYKIENCSWVTSTDNLYFKTYRGI